MPSGASCSRPTASRSRRRPGSATDWASSSSTARCAISWACATRAACLTGGAPLGADTFRFFRSFGVNLKQVYGATEACGLVSLQGDNEADPNTVGRIVPETQVRIGERGEVEVKGPGVFVGYYKQDEATRDAITPDGWLKTGDAGLVDPRGQLAIIDRAKDVGKLADGTPFAPQFIENKLKFSPYIREAVAFGDQRSFVAAMVAIDITHGRQMGRAAQPGLHELHGPRRASRRWRA